MQPFVNFIADADREFLAHGSVRILRPLGHSRRIPAHLTDKSSMRTGERVAGKDAPGQHRLRELPYRAYMPFLCVALRHPRNCEADAGEALPIADLQHSRRFANCAAELPPGSQRDAAPENHRRAEPGHQGRDSEDCTTREKATESRKASPAA